MIRFVLVGFLCSFLSVLPVAAQDFAALGQRTEGAVGRVIAFEGNRMKGTGTGFVIGRANEKNSYFMITNEHVVEGASSLEVGFLGDDKVVAFRTRVLSKSKGFDLALLLISAPSDPTFKPDSLKLADRDLVRGEPVFALGFPGASQTLATQRSSVDFFTSTLTTGTLSKVYEGTWGEVNHALELVEHSSTINTGNSGGPLMDGCGNVVGVNSAFLINENNTYLSASSNAVREFLVGSRVEYTNASSCNPNSFFAGVANRKMVWVGFGVVSAVVVLMVLIDRANGGAGARAVRRVIVIQSPTPVAKDPEGGRRRRPASRAKKKSGPVLYVVSPSLGLTVPRGLTSTELKAGIVIGRGADADLKIDNPILSRRHAKLALKDRKLLLTDLGSSNGVRVDGRALSANSETQINTSSLVELGGLQIQFSRPKAG